LEPVRPSPAMTKKATQVMMNAVTPREALGSDLWGGLHEAARLRSALRSPPPRDAASGRGPCDRERAS
jgi:hypothetical protein